MFQRAILLVALAAVPVAAGEPTSPIGAGHALAPSPSTAGETPDLAREVARALAQRQEIPALDAAHADALRGAFREAAGPRSEDDAIVDVRALRRVYESSLPAIALAPGADVRPGPYDTSEFLAGKIAVTVVLVDGPKRKFSAKDRSAALADAVEGLDLWVRKIPAAKLSFVWRVHQVSVSTDAIDLSSDARSGWAREAAAAVLGAPVQDDIEGTYEIDRRARASLGADWGVTFYFVRGASGIRDLFKKRVTFKDGAGAFTLLGGPYGVIPYSRIDGVHFWNPPIICHELAHFFYALDEYSAYAKQGHDAHERSGYLDAPNSNLQGPGHTSDTPCLMRGSFRAVMKYLEEHFLAIFKAGHRPAWDYPICSATREATGCSTDPGVDVVKPLAPLPTLTAQAKRNGATVAVTGTSAVGVLANRNPYARGHQSAPKKDLTIDALVRVRARLLPNGAWTPATPPANASSISIDLDVPSNGQETQAVVEVTTRFGRTTTVTVAITP
jgi:hypothetical protein